MTLLKKMLKTVIVFLSGCYIANLIFSYSTTSVIPNEKKSNPRQRDYEHLAKLDDKFEHLMWFVQVSDIHITVYGEHNRGPDLEVLLRDISKAVKPSVVLVSGDLTHARSGNSPDTRQIEEEWKIYKDAITRSGILDHAPLLDVRGNHDSFDVSHVNSHKNYHRRYSVQGQKNPRSYSHVVEANGDQYAFLAVDAAMFPGLKSPHNFFGIIAPDEWQKVLTLESEIPKDAYKIFFGHYPSSVIVSPSPGIQSLLSKGLVYLCGHLHTLGGLIHHMYALQPLGNLELELADWKFSRRFRVAAIDHGLFSFVDHTMSEWPIILVTNPKDNSLSSPLKEPLHLMQNSTHVRVLVFSLQGVERIRVKVASGSWVTAVHTNGPLYVVPWDLLLWNQSVKGTLLLHVEAVEKDGNSRTVSQPFSLDGTYSQTSFGARFVLRTNMLKMVQVLFYSCVGSLILLLCFMRIFHQMVVRRWVSVPSFRPYCCGQWLRKIWLMTTLNMIFYPLVILLLYTAIGPIFGGELIEGYYGVGFAWGIYVGPWYVPGSQSFTIGFLHVAIVQVPLILTLADQAYLRYRAVQRGRGTTFKLTLARSLPLLLIVISLFVVALFSLFEFGILHFLAGPLHLWTALLICALWYKTSTLPPCSFRNIAFAWMAK